MYTLLIRSLTWTYYLIVLPLVVFSNVIRLLKQFNFPVNIIMSLFVHCTIFLRRSMIHITGLLFDLSYKQTFLFIIPTISFSFRLVTLICYQSIKLLFHAIISSCYGNTSYIFLFFYAISYLDISSDPL